ncbi:MAG TPA: hypothetical protein VD908_18950 [Cytophagales bacterium]|nr:hypothetical protein [Cytophagales bacterium]
MIGILLLYFIGKAFFTLKEQSKKGKWGYAVLGIVTYFLGSMLGGVAVVLAMEVWEPGSTDAISERLLEIIALPFGLLACWLLYKQLKKQQTKPHFDKGEVLDADLIE